MIYREWSSIEPVGVLSPMCTTEKESADLHFRENWIIFEDEIIFAQEKKHE